MGILRGLRTLAVLTFGLVAGCASAPSERPRLPASSFDDEGLEQALLDFYRPLMRPLGRELDAYHYVRKDADLGFADETPVDREADSVRSHVRSWSSWFTSGEQLVGPGGDTQGLYYSFDPASARVYGGKRWALFRTRMPKGLNVLDLAKLEMTARGLEFPSELKAALAERECPDNDPRSLLFRRRSAVCRRLALKALETLRPDAIVYGWQSFGFAKICPERSPSALLLLNPDAVTESATSVFAAADDDAANLAERQVLQKLLDLAVPPEGQAKPEALWPKIKRASLEKATAWARARLHDCEGP